MRTRFRVALLTVCVVVACTTLFIPGAQCQETAVVDPGALIE